MFAGLPGIGVGTLFYVLIGLSMPLLELVRVARGTSSLARWRTILRQCFFALSIVASIMFAERWLMLILGEAGPASMSPARTLNRELSTHTPESILAAPITAALLLLVTVLLLVEVLHVFSVLRQRWANSPGAAGQRVDERPLLSPGAGPSQSRRRVVSTVERDRDWVATDECRPAEGSSPLRNSDHGLRGLPGSRS